MKLLFGFFLILFANSSGDTESDSTSWILDFWKTQDEEFRLSAEKDVVLVLGNTGTGKSTLTLLLTGADLEAVETFEDSGHYVIIDKNNKVSRNDTILSKTLIPELMIDNNTNTVYYDCPGFIDTRSVAHDITISYFLNKLINHANSVKLLFAIDSPSVQTGGDRRNFLDLAKNAATLVKKIDKYRDGIGLIVTKVESRYKKNKLVDDDKEIRTIAHFLNGAKEVLIQKNAATNVSPMDRRLNIESIKFIDAILTMENDKYQRIGIFRRVDDSGPLRDNELIQSEKNAIETIVNRNIRYIQKENSDFGYTISADSKNRIHQLVDEIENRLLNIVSEIGDQIEQFYLQQEKENPDITLLYDKMLTGYQKLSQINEREPRMFLKQLIDAENELGIGLSSNILNNFENNLDHIQFLTTTNDESISNSLNLASELKSSGSLNMSRKWYRFLIDLYEEMSGYTTHSERIKDSANQLVRQCSIADTEKINITAISLPSFLDQIHSKVFPDVDITQVNAFQLEKLRILLDELVISEVVSSCSSDKLSVFGYNVKLTEVVAMNCYSRAKQIEIFALNTLFIDADIDKTGQKAHVSMIAPTWKVIGNRQIVLNGENGGEYTWVSNGYGNTVRGSDGSPGLPGGAAGTFFGVGGHFTDGRRLKIYLCGGMGGTGQNGGQGSNGIQGQDGIPPPGIHMILFQEVEFPGENAVKAGDGGNGGVGGLGGPAGDFLLLGLQQSNVQITASPGKNGGRGRGGKAGITARNGNTIQIFNLPIPDFSFLDGQKPPPTENRFIVSNGSPAPGKDGVDGQNAVGLQQPPNGFKIRNPSFTINSFKKYVREHLDSVRESKLRQFLKELEENRDVQAVYDTKGFVNELHILEDQYFQLRHRLSFNEFTESLIKRIDEYAKSNPTNCSFEDKKVLRFLQNTALKKIEDANEYRKNFKFLNFNDRKIQSVDRGEKLICAYNVSIYDETKEKPSTYCRVK